MADYDTGLGKNEANYAPLTPIDFIRRSAAVYGNRVAMIHGDYRQTWAETFDRCRQLASALRNRGIKRNSTELYFFIIHLQWLKLILVCLCLVAYYVH